MPHYFTNDDSQNRNVQNLKHIKYNFRGHNFKFTTHGGVFSKDHVDYATDILLNSIPVNSIPAATTDNTLLDMGCGYGCIGIVLAKTYGLKLTQADINKAALELTKHNCKINEINSIIIESDCFDNINEKFNLITINPPIHAGKTVTYKMYESAAYHLKPDGKLYVVTLKKHGAESTLTKLQEIFGVSNCTVIYKKKGFYVFECFMR